MTFSLAKLGRSQWRLYLFTKTVPFLSSESGCRRFSTVVSDGYGTTVISCSLLTRTINQYCLMSLFCCDQSSKLRFPLFLLIMSENIHKKLQDISLGIDDEIVNLPLDLCEEAAEENRFSLITRPINPRRQNLRAMMLAFPRLWGFSDEVTGRLLQNQQVQFIFTSEEAMLSVLRRGPWSFNEWMCSIQRWHPNHTDDELKFIPFWVQVRGIPLQFLTQRMVIHI